MGDMKEVFDMMRNEKKERHNEWYEKNMKLLNESGLSFIKKDTVCLFREKDNLKIDFYPHTGRWKHGNKMYRGGAGSFIKWYLKR